MSDRDGPHSCAPAAGPATRLGDQARGTARSARSLADTFQPGDPGRPGEARKHIEVAAETVRAEALSVVAGVQLSTTASPMLGSAKRALAGGLDYRSTRAGTGALALCQLNVGDFRAACDRRGRVTHSDRLNQPKLLCQRLDAGDAAVLRRAVGRARTSAARAVEDGCDITGWLAGPACTTPNYWDGQGNSIGPQGGPGRRQRCIERGEESKLTVCRRTSLPARNLGGDFSEAPDRGMP